MFTASLQPQTGNSLNIHLPKEEKVNISWLHHTAETIQQWKQTTLIQSLDGSQKPWHKRSRTKKTAYGTITRIWSSGRAKLSCSNWGSIISKREEHKSEIVVALEGGRDREVYYQERQPRGFWDAGNVFVLNVNGDNMDHTGVHLKTFYNNSLCND